MIKLFKLIILSLSLLFISCVGVHKEYPDDTGLVLKATKSRVNVDESESVSFTVFYNGEDITEFAKITYNINEIAGEIATQSFIPLDTGDYRFTAHYGYKSSNDVIVTAYQSQKWKPFYKRVNIMEFTGTWCVYCPNMAKAVEEVMKEMPDRMVTTALHSVDKYSIPEESILENYFKINGFPAVIVDFMAESYIGLSSPELIKKAVKEAIETYPAVCGISIESSCDNNLLSVGVKVKFTKRNDYKISISVLEDGIIGSQSGISGYYTHSNTLRQYLTDPMGDYIGTIEAEEEFSKTYSVEFDGSNMVAENCRIVVCVLDRQPDGRYFSNNISTCSVNGTKGYEQEI